MLNLILVDDDILHTQHLEKSIQWGDFGFKNPICFSDSAQAIGYLKENDVDAVITDIEMPTFTGLDIASFCKQNSPKTRIILFSECCDFENARMAIKSGNVVDYVKKPVDCAEFSESLKTLVYFLKESPYLPAVSSTLGRGDAIIEKAYEYMQKNYDKNISLGVVADYIHISQSYLSLYFKKTTKKNFIDALTEIRMQNVIKLLNETSYSIEKICGMVGYKNASHFRKMFKRYFGTTPTKYKKRTKDANTRY